MNDSTLAWNECVERAKATSILQIIRARGIKLPYSGSKRMHLAGPCPHCGGDDRFSVNVSKGKGLFYCRHCNVGGGGAIDLVKFIDDTDFVGAVAVITGGTPPSKAGDALDLWREARDPHGTPVEAYLARRRLTLPPNATALRFHPACPFAGTKTPAMVALVRNIESNAPQAIHRTALDLDGDKIEINGKSKMALGPIRGGAIKITADEHVTVALGIAEGIETALSLQRLPEWQGSPVWSLISAGGIRKFPLLSGIETLAIAADHDTAGERATIEVAERWQEREVLVIEAHAEGADLNDVVREAS
jgi:Toprim domain/Zinc-binding domain of primase-helicase